MNWMRDEMKTLDEKVFDRVAGALRRHARPLDWQVWQVIRGVATWTDVVPVLTGLQNPDGGFGHGIEPDVWHPASSPLATTIGLQYAELVWIPQQHPLLQRALVYLMATYDEVAGKWHPMSAGVNDFPHAPWWHADADTGKNALDGDWPNPTVEIIGYLGAHAPTWPHVPALYDALVAYVEQAETIESHALACYVRAYPGLPEAVQQAVFPRLVRLLRSTVQADSTQWLTAYVPTPLDYVQAPTSPFVGEMADLVDMQLTQWVEYLQAHDMWYPTWQWGQYADEWQIAQRWWAGKMTVERMAMLKRFGRIG